MARMRAFRLNKVQMFVLLATIMILAVVIYSDPDIVSVLPYGGPIGPYTEEEPNQGANANDKYLLAPHIAYVGNDTDQFPTSEKITYSARAYICIDGEFQESVDSVSSGFVLESGFYTSQYYTPDEIERMHVEFACHLFDNEGTSLWTWNGHLRMKDASVFWDNDDLYAKHYNTVDEDGFSMTVYLMRYEPSGAGVIESDPQDTQFVWDLQVFLMFCFVVGLVALYFAWSKKNRRLQWQKKLSSYHISPIGDLDIPEPEPTEEELEEIRLDGVRKESRLKMLEEMVQSLTAVHNPQHVLDNTEMSIEDFEPENEREELVFGVLCNLHEEAKEKVRLAAIKEDR